MKNAHLVGSAIEMASQREVMLSSKKVKHTEVHVFCSEHVPMSQGPDHIRQSAEKALSI